MPITTKRRRQTIFPPDSHVSGNSFISNDRHRNRHRMEHLLEPPGSTSVIEISSAENTPIPTLGLQDPRSSVRISSVQQGRATRLTDVDMVLEDTGRFVVGDKQGGIMFNFYSMIFRNVCPDERLSFAKI